MLLVTRTFIFLKRVVRMLSIAVFPSARNLGLKSIKKFLGLVQV